MTIELSNKQTITVQKHDQKTLIMRMAIASGTTDDGDEFQIGSNVSSGDIVAYFSKESRYYTVQLREIVDRIMDARKEMKKETAIDTHNQTP